MDLIDKGIKARRGHRRLHVAAGGPTGARPAPMPDLRPLIAAQRPAALLSGQPAGLPVPSRRHGPAASRMQRFRRRVRMRLASYPGHNHRSDYPASRLAPVLGEPGRRSYAF